MADVIPTVWDTTYELTKCRRRIDSTSSGSFSIKIREIERILVKSPSGRETLVQQGNVEGENEATEFVSELSSMLLAGGEEICTRFVAIALSETKIESWLQDQLTPFISKYVIDVGLSLGQEGGRFNSLNAYVDVVKEMSFVSFNDTDSESHSKPIEEECVICLEKMSNDKEKKIMKLWCDHSFHRHCILSWLRGKHSCPTCRDDTRDPRPHSSSQER